MGFDHIRSWYELEEINEQQERMITVYENEIKQLEKENAIIANRELMGATNPKEAKEGTIRKKYGISIDKNSVHGSDSLENSKIEINFFFKD